MTRCKTLFSFRVNKLEKRALKKGWSKLTSSATLEKELNLVENKLLIYTFIHLFNFIILLDHNKYSNPTDMSRN